METPLCSCSRFLETDAAVKAQNENIFSDVVFLPPDNTAEDKNWFDPRSCDGFSNTGYNFKNAVCRT